MGRNAASLPTAMIVSSAFVNALWSLYGLLIKDVILSVASMIGFLFCTFQILVLLWCWNKLPFDLAFLTFFCRGPAASAKDPLQAEEIVFEDWKALDSDITAHA